MKFLGLLVLVNVLLIAGYLYLASNVEVKRIVAFVLVGAFIGIAIMVSERLTGVKVPGVGELTVATQRAMAGAENVEKIQAEVETQRDSIGMIVRDANQAREEIGRVDKYAKGVETTLKSQLETGEKKRAELDTAVAEGKALLKELQRQAQFQSLATSATIFDDRKAFEELKLIAADSADPFKAQAGRTIYAIEREYAGLQKSYKNVVWTQGETFDFSTLTAAKLISDFEKLDPAFETGTVVQVWGQLKFKKSIRVEVLIYVMRHARTLQAANQAARLIAAEANLKLNPPFEFDGIFAWYDKNKGILEMEDQKK